MPEELLRMSSQFKKDMRKLNMMKEVKVLIENQQQMGLLSESQKLITKKLTSLKLANFQGPNDPKDRT